MVCLSPSETQTRPAPDLPGVYSQTTPSPGPKRVRELGARRSPQSVLLRCNCRRPRRAGHTPVPARQADLLGPTACPDRTSTFSGGMVRGSAASRWGRRDAVHPDALLAQQLSEAGTEVGDRRLGGGVRARVGEGMSEFTDELPMIEDPAFMWGTAAFARWKKAPMLVSKVRSQSRPESRRATRRSSDRQRC